MIIKEVLLTEEKERVTEFLLKFDLKFDKDITKTFYVEEDDSIVGTISVANYIIKDLAVLDKYQGENIASSLINHVIKYFSNNSIYNYQVFSKPKYKSLFENMNFKMLVETEKLIMLEGGITDIDETLEKIKKLLEVRFTPINENSDIASVVINGNPITIGHEYLVSEASLNHNIVIVFIVEEDKSEFTFIERLSMAFLAFHKFSNVYVIPSTKYIVSSLTFPNYFLKETDISEEMAKVDALIFKKYFQKKLFIKKRYIGSESTKKMENYNNELKEILGDTIKIVERLEIDRVRVSASAVRNLIKEGKTKEALKYIPRECHMIVKSVITNRY